MGQRLCQLSRARHRCKTNDKFRFANEGTNKSPRPSNRYEHCAKLGCASGLIFSLVIAHVRVPKYVRSMERGLAFESHLDTL